MLPFTACSAHSAFSQLPYTQARVVTVTKNGGRFDAIYVLPGSNILELNGMLFHLSFLPATQLTVGLIKQSSSTRKPLRLGVNSSPSVVPSPNLKTNWEFVTEHLARNFPHVTTVIADIYGVPQEIMLYRRDPQPKTE